MARTLLSEISVAINAVGEALNSNEVSLNRFLLKLYLEHFFLVEFRKNSFRPFFGSGISGSVLSPCLCY